MRRRIAGKSVEAIRHFVEARDQLGQLTIIRFLVEKLLDRRINQLRFGGAGLQTGAFQQSRCVFAEDNMEALFDHLLQNFGKTD